jgi:hypothetical protein
MEFNEPRHQRVATLSALPTAGFCRWEKPTVNHRTIDRGYRLWTTIGLRNTNKIEPSKAAA